MYHKLVCFRWGECVTSPKREVKITDQSWYFLEIITQIFLCIFLVSVDERTFFAFLGLWSHHPCLKLSCRVFSLCLVLVCVRPDSTSMETEPKPGPCCISFLKPFVCVDSCNRIYTHPGIPYSDFIFIFHRMTFYSGPLPNKVGFKSFSDCDLDEDLFL